MPRKEKVGTVVSNKMDKTIVVEVQEKQPDPKYKKYRNRRAKFKAHDENNSCEMGDVVRIIESRPYSKEKTWRFDSVLERVQQV